MNENRHIHPVWFMTYTLDQISRHCLLAHWLFTKNEVEARCVWAGVRDIGIKARKGLVLVV